MEELEEIPLYPYIKSEKRGLDSMRLNVIDVRTGELLAWMDEGKGPRSRQGSMAKKFKSEHVENLNDHVLKVESEESSPFDPTSVFISCLDVRTTKEEIFSHFIPLGEIVRVTKLKDRKSGNYNGSAYVQFRYPQSAEDALFLHGSCVSGCMIMVKRKLKSTAEMKQEQSDNSASHPSSNVLRNSSAEIVVRNFDGSTTQLDLASHFQGAGDISGVTIVKSNEDEPTEAIIHFKDAKSVEPALWLNNSQLGGKTLVVEEIKPQDIATATDKNNNDYDEDSVFVGNMKARTTEVDLANHFFNIGDILRLTILKNKVMGQRPRKSAAYIQFKDAASAREALGLNGSVLNGNKLVVKKKKKNNM